MGSRRKWSDTLTRPFEVKADSFATETKDDGAKTGRFEGYLSVFGNEDSYSDIVEKGAFARTIEQNGLFPLLWFHDPAEPIGVFSAKEDDTGLYITARINLETQRGAEVYSGMRFEAEEMGGDAAYITELSIGFNDIDSDSEDGVRHLREVALREGSLLTMHFAANDQAVVTVKSGGERMTEEQACVLRELRDCYSEASETLTEMLSSVPVGDTGLSDDSLALVAEAVGFDPFASEEQAEEPVEEHAEVDTHAILEIVEHARATLAR